MKLLGTITLFIFSTLSFGQGAGAPSQDELLKNVIAGIGAKDEKALAQLVISKEEFKKYVWPAVASRVAGSNMNDEKFYTMYSQSSGVGITEGFARLGGKTWEVVRVVPGAVQKEGKGYKLFFAPEVVVRDAGGQEQTVRPVGGLLEQGGSFKVTTYYVGAQRAAK